MGKLPTKVGEITSLGPDLATLQDGSSLDIGLVVACVSFHCNTTVCKRSTGTSQVMDANYLAPNLMYLAGAEIDNGAFNSFCESSVLEYALEGLHGRLRLRAGERSGGRSGSLGRPSAAQRHQRPQVVALHHSRQTLRGQVRARGGPGAHANERPHRPPLALLPPQHYAHARAPFEPDTTTAPLIDREYISVLPKL